MKCRNCGEKLETIESRSLETNDGLSFVRRTKRCNNKHSFISHEMASDISPIPDIYRVKRVRKSKPKPKKIHSLDWVERIENKLNEL